MALVALITPLKSEQVSLVINPQIAPLVTFSQEQICAESGKLEALPKAEPPSPPLAPNINSSAFSGKAILFLKI